MSNSHLYHWANAVGNAAQQTECAHRLSPSFWGQNNMCLWTYSQHVGKEHSPNIWFKFLKIIRFPDKKNENFIFACWTASNILFSELVLLFHCTLPSVLACLKFQSPLNFLHFLLRIISVASLFEICLYARQFWTGPFRPSKVNINKLCQ